MDFSYYSIDFSTFSLYTLFDGTKSNLKKTGKRKCIFLEKGMNKRGKANVSPEDIPRFHKFLQDLVKESPEGTIEYFCSQLHKFDKGLSYSVSGLSKVLPKANIYQITKEPPLWEYRPPEETPPPKNPVHKKLKGLAKNTPIGYQRTSYILTIPTNPECERRLCQKLHSHYKELDNVSFIPGYQSICIICGDKSTYEDIFEDINSFFYVKSSESSTED